MKDFTPRSFLAMTLVLTVGQAYAAAPTVGLVVAKDMIRIDSSPVRGNATVLSGNVLESAGGTSEVRLKNGGSVMMAVNAKVRMFENTAELQSGKIQLTGAQANASQIRVEADAGSSAVLSRAGNTVYVGSLRGAVRVTNKAGVLIARLAPGAAREFEADPQSGAGTGAQTGSQTGGTTAAQTGAQAGGTTGGTAGGTAAGGAAGGAGTGIGTLATVAIVGGVATAIAVPVAVVATRDDAPPVVSR